MQNNHDRYDAMNQTAKQGFLSGDKQAMAAAAGAVYNGDTDTIETVCLGRSYAVGCSNAHISPVGHTAELTDIEPAMVLLNLTMATGRPLTGKLLTYRELFKDARAPLSAMQSSADKFARIFGERPKKLYSILDEFPGERAAQGDASIKIYLLPRLPVVFSVWEGEGGVIPPSSSILYDSTAADYLPQDALNVFPAHVLDKFCAYGLRA